MVIFIAMIWIVSVQDTNRGKISEKVIMPFCLKVYTSSGDHR